MEAEKKTENWTACVQGPKSQRKKQKHGGGGWKGQGYENRGGGKNRDVRGTGKESERGNRWYACSERNRDGVRDYEKRQRQNRG